MRVTHGAQLGLFTSRRVGVGVGAGVDAVIGAGIGGSFAGLTRTALACPPGEEAWFDYCPAWLEGHESVLDELARSVRWRQEERVMYERTVSVPRLYATLPDDGAVPAVLEQARSLLSQHYGENFERLSLGYYRDGRDSVAWHGDYVARRMPRATVATISVGAPRPFCLRPKAGGKVLTLQLGWGDLLVMGGSCQRTWQHAVPKRKQAAPRIAIMFRPLWQEP